MSRNSSETVAAQALADAEKQTPARDNNAASSDPNPNDRPSGAVANDKARDEYCVVLEPEDDPKTLSSARKCVVVMVISIAGLCATCASSMASFTEEGLSRTFHTSHEVTILSISLYVEGLGLGPLLVGPLSEVWGRNIIYQVSYFLFFALTWPTVFPPDIATFLVFRFITGFCASAFLSVAGGSVSDLYTNDKVATPMALYTLCIFIGPVAGPLIAGFINQNVDWRWTYRVLLMWQFVVLICLVFFVPETYVPIILKRKARRLRKKTGDDRYHAPIEREEKSLSHMILLSCYVPFKLIFYERMALALDIWTSLILGIVYLAFQAWPVIFEQVHGFDVQSTGLAFLGIGIGMVIAVALQPFWNRFNRREAEKYNGNPPPEVLLVMGQVGGVLAPLGLFWLAFTTYKSVHWIVPIIASAPFGAGVFWIFTSTFTYLVTAYRPIAASAMAANSAMRSTFAAAFPLFAGAMYSTLGTVGATALLAGLTTVMAPLPFIFYKIGARLRATSRFAA
ncbi:MFS general substrate transporter [Obba rivulosa]|uniref:MFS general substrate transporter n=1 Tax=Obba rivulosa TaxID=1052685 RepID=A0A8E2DPY3_9APHY|nr:MFS general substrate transporter [Obba rivulosa]